MAMTYARKSLISLKDTPYYHVVARCVRQAWLSGVHQSSGKDYSHRKAWVLRRLEQLSSMYAIDICAYAVMSNHYHLVLRVDLRRAQAWTTDEVIERWMKLFSRPPLVKRLQQGLGTAAERKTATEIVEKWRSRLCDVSWYMRCLNEHLARRANIEDNCKGRFWEGRFKSQALLDDAGLLTAMAYVDLNPIRAGIANRPETSEFTSIHSRIQQLQPGKPKRSSALATSVRVPLLGFRDSASSGEPAIPFNSQHYMALVDWSGRARRPGKRGVIDPTLPPILQRLNIDATAWGLAMQSGGNRFGRAMGKIDRMRLHAKTVGQCWIKGLRQAERLYS
jgi:REP element-mobilizing transposase RayT